ncbi:TPA: peptidase M12 [Pseudomonas putida]|nr:peptidase M12 [Pseudomonas putida]
MDTLHLCGGLAPVDPEISHEHATQEDSANSPNSGGGGRKKRSIGEHSKFWAQHRTLKIAIFSKDQAFITLIKSAINLWTPHINLNIEFVENTETADIRISTDKSLNGHWSTIGTDALAMPANVPTMHFDLVNWAYTSHVWTGIILHEFGHALGLEHEHQHPDADIDWNTHSVYEECKKNEGWSQEKTHYNIFRKLKKSKSTSAPYDQKSIMHYCFSEKFIWNKKAIPFNYTLSEKDISFIRSIYPPKA